MKKDVCEILTHDQTQARTIATLRLRIEELEEFVRTCHIANLDSVEQLKDEAQRLLEKRKE
jgi:hypothetical protein